MRSIFVIVLSVFCCLASAQVGKYRSDFSIGVNGGYIMSDVGFEPQVTQKMTSGFTGGLSFRYVCEKYFSTICSKYFSQ